MWGTGPRFCVVAMQAGATARCMSSGAMHVDVSMWQLTVGSCVGTARRAAGVVVGVRRSTMPVPSVSQTLSHSAHIVTIPPTPPSDSVTLNNSNNNTLALEPRRRPPHSPDSRSLARAEFHCARSSHSATSQLSDRHCASFAGGIKGDGLATALPLTSARSALDAHEVTGVFLQSTLEWDSLGLVEQGTSERVASRTEPKHQTRTKNVKFKGCCYC